LYCHSINTGFGAVNAVVAGGARVLSVAAAPGRALFWSGMRSTTAAEFAASTGLTTLEMTTAGRFLTATQSAVLPIRSHSTNVNGYLNASRT
jgi:hypothetical protein